MSELKALVKKYEHYETTEGTKCLAYRMPSGDLFIFDSEDQGKIEKYNWFLEKRKNCFYVRGTIKKGKDRVYLHRFLMDFPTGEIDHIDGNGLNNRRKNLRVCTRRENIFNCGKKRKHKKYKGVYYDKRRNKYYSQIYKDKKSFFGGYHETEESAARSYNRLSLHHHGKFAKLNKIEGHLPAASTGHIYKSDVSQAMLFNSQDLPAHNGRETLS